MKGLYREKTRGFFFLATFLSIVLVRFPYASYYVWFSWPPHSYFYCILQSSRYQHLDRLSAPDGINTGICFRYISIYSTCAVSLYFLICVWFSCPPHWYFYCILQLSRNQHSNRLSAPEEIHTGNYLARVEFHQRLFEIILKNLSIKSLSTKFLYSWKRCQENYFTSVNLPIYDNFWRMFGMS